MRAKKVILQCLNAYQFSLENLVEEFLRDGVTWVAVVGVDCSRVEDIVDELVVGYGDDPSRFLMTTSHPGETVEEVVHFMRSLTGEYEGHAVDLVTI